MKRDSNNFSAFLKQKRKETSLTQRQLADKAGVGIHFIRDVEQGKNSIRLDTLNAVLELFGCCAGPIRIKEELHLKQSGGTP